MNYNPNNPQRLGPGKKKARHVSNVAAMGMPSSPSPPPAYRQSPFGVGPNAQASFDESGFDSQNYGMNSPNPNMGYSQFQVNSGPNPQMAGMSQFVQNTQFGAMLQQPMVQDMAMEFGQHLASQGKDIVNKKIEKYVSVSELKYYFAVDTKYVIKKLFLIFFPFTHKDWSVKYDQDHPVQPRYELNAPDLYIPTMAYVTYVVLAGFVLGMQHRFSPEQIGIIASSALAYSIFELCIYAFTKYVMNIQTKLGVYDLLSYSGYKYTIIIASIITSLLFKNTGYYICMIYCSIAISFFLMRTLKVQVLADPSIHHEYSQETYTQPRHSGGSKRKHYFMFSIILMQPILTWWLSYHFIPSSVIGEIP